MENSLLISGGAVIHAGGVWPVGWLRVEDGRIVALGEGAPPEAFNRAAGRSIDAAGGVILPGFIDLHVHGAVGYDTMDGSPDGLCEMARFYAAHGTTTFLPTTWTESRAKITGALAALGSLIDQPTGGAAILGAHLEGPYISENKVGAQDPRQVRRADREEALAWLETGLVRLIALAPEFEANHWLIAECARRGIVVSAAHTEAGPEDIARAVELGLTQATHTFNAMIGLHHRQPGTVGAVLANDAITCEVIADNLHVHPLVMKVLVRAKGIERVLLVSDAVAPAGLPDGQYKLEDRDIIVQEGAVRLPDGTIAGSTLTMDAALRNIMAATGLSLAEAWPVSSLNAARQIGVDDRKGQLAPGYDADLVLLDADHQVRLTVVGGQVVFERP